MRKPPAFTLVELVVAMGVTSLLLGLMVMIFNQGSAIWQRSDERLDTFRESRLAIDVMARELSGVAPIPRTSASGDGSAESATDPLATFPVLALQSHPESLPDDRVNDEIYALTASANGGRGALCAIGYFCVWDGKRSAFVLRRQFTDSDATFASLSRVLTTTGMSLGAFDVLFSRFPNSDVPQAAHQVIEDVATYVWGFKLAIPEDGESAASKRRPNVFCRRLPGWIEIRFKALGPNAARKIARRPLSRESWLDEAGDDYRKFILPAEQQFVTRVKLCR